MVLRFRTALPIVLGVALVSGCKAPGPAADTLVETVAVPALSPQEIDELDAIVLGAWAHYPRPKESEWPTEPLNVRRWATTSAELACAGRAHLGDPHKQRAASDRILHHHHTNAQEVMEFGIRLNEDPARAQSSGGLVAEAAERCR
jgi:hypothetical protein